MSEFEREKGGGSGSETASGKSVKCCLAPMEGVTGRIYRNAHHSFFPDIDVYFTPFLTPNKNHRFSSRELNDVLPENNAGITLIPQILTNCAEDFIWMAEELKAMGYDEINLNLGCPSGTVVSKYKGAGFLAKKEGLNAFLYEVCSKISARLSVKTRLGLASPDEFEELLEIYNQYPLKELIIHPRVRSDFYKNTPNLEAFRKALDISRNEVWYNGDIFTTENWETFHGRFPEVNSVMLGRGVIANPGLAGQIKGSGQVDRQQLREFHDAVYCGYRETIPGDRNVLFKMKELWFYMLHLFPGSEKYGKRIRKAERTADYEAAVDSLFRDLDIGEGCGYRGEIK